MLSRTVRRNGVKVVHDEYKRMKSAAGITYSVGPNVMTLNDLADTMIIEILAEIFPRMATAMFIYDVHEKAIEVVVHLPEPVSSDVVDVLKDLGLTPIRPRMFGKKPKRGEISLPSIIRGEGHVIVLKLDKRYKH